MDLRAGLALLVLIPASLVLAPAVSDAAPLSVRDARARLDEVDARVHAARAALEAASAEREASWNAFDAMNATSFFDFAVRGAWLPLTSRYQLARERYLAAFEAEGRAHASYVAVLREQAAALHEWLAALDRATAETLELANQLLDVMDRLSRPVPRPDCS